MSTPQQPGEGKQGPPPKAAERQPSEQSEPTPPGAAAGSQKQPAPSRPSVGKSLDDKPADGAAAAGPAQGSGPASQKSAPTPPWQRGQQREPQTNLNRPSGPVAGPSSAGSRPPAGPPKPPAQTGPGKPGTNGGTGTGKPASSRPVITGTAAPKPPAGPNPVGAPSASGAAGAAPGSKAAAKETARAKAAVIDGPTRSIARTDLPKDMPDLSAVKHPTGAPGSARKAASAALTGAPVADGDTLRATVQLRRIDPWSTLKVSLVISVALFFVWMVAVGLLYIVLDGMGVWDRLNNAFTDIVSESNSGGLVTSGQVFGYSALVGLINVVLLTALATIGSFIYNLCSDLVGGVQVTLADPD